MLLAQLEQPPRCNVQRSENNVAEARAAKSMQENAYLAHFVLRLRLLDLIPGPAPYLFRAQDVRPGNLIALAPVQAKGRGRSADRSRH